MDDVTRKARTRRTRSAYLGTTSDGVRIPRPPRGRGNLSAAQIRKIVDGLVKATRPLVQESGARRQRLLQRLEPQERQILLDVAEGLSDDDLAQKLNMTTDEFDRARRTAMARVGARDRSQLIDLLFGQRPSAAQ